MKASRFLGIQGSGEIQRRRRGLEWVEGKKKKTIMQKRKSRRAVLFFSVFAISKSCIQNHSIFSTNLCNMFYYNNHFKMGNSRFSDLRDLSKFRWAVVGKGLSPVPVSGSSAHWEHAHCVVFPYPLRPKGGRGGYCERHVAMFFLSHSSSIHSTANFLGYNALLPGSLFYCPKF